ncbi:kunitz-type serine protease inhibitor A-like isoform X2 [Rhipicephalus microplus]|uniref:kunitz-type serine protease inhibitor A-like isoform X1 n=1 Tax=Rhipicephalus microplus TaxID=6941 RepID=UPI003F6C3B79
MNLAGVLLLLFCMVFTQAVGRRWKCYLPPETGVCRARITKWYFDRRTDSCRSFIYGGCGGNENKFSSEEECLAECAPRRHIPPSCYKETETGRCRARQPSWYFDSSRGHCKVFIYGGCDGNKNRFSTEEECMGTCAPSSRYPVVCSQRPSLQSYYYTFLYFYQYGQRVWYFNPVEAICEQFQPGQLPKSSNFFQSCQACSNTCTKYNSCSSNPE